ncbi:phosphatase PAP2 family protein [Dokdonia genika]|uniref:Phosphatase PAP2 family protein n=1 Tax=Dokdonia genika TaxID=308113 RepID=A0ABV9L6Z4_9FLAO
MQKELKSVIKQIKRLLSKYYRKYDDRIPYLITVLITAPIVVGGINLFLELTEDLKSEYLVTYDASISEAIASYRTPSLTQYFIYLTDIGNAIGYLIVFSVCTLIFYLVFKNWRYVAQIVLVMVLALSSNLILKQIINRARPEAEHLVTVETLSYPSGHAMMAMAFYGILIYLITQFNISKIWKFLIILLLAVLILSIGISRIYLGVHYPSDIAGGFIAGFIWVVFCVMIFNLMNLFKRDAAT